MAKDKYEISLWEDVLVPAQNDVPAHYEDQKIAVIGADTMTATCRAYNAKLVQNINGTNTFTFKMYYKCRDTDLDSVRYQITGGIAPTTSGSHSIDGQLRALKVEDGQYQNPFLDLLVNERKVKVKWKGEWYTFVIKNIQENTSDKSITYTCKDLFINDLSKNGYNLEFKTDLGNNQGTARYLAGEVLDGSDWKFDSENSDIIQQEIEEPVYEVTTLKSTSTPKNVDTEATTTIGSGKTVLLFYSTIQSWLDSGKDDGEDYLQFVYNSTYKTEPNSQLVLDPQRYYWESTVWHKRTETVSNVDVPVIIIGANVSSPWVKIYYQNGVSNNYRAERIVRQQLSVFDPLTKRYANVFVAADDSDPYYAEGDLVYEYTNTQYKEANAVVDLMVNGSNFVDTKGWLGNDLLFQMHPLYSLGSEEDPTPITDYNPKAYLRLAGDNLNYNSALTSSSQYLKDGIQTGDKFVFRMRAHPDAADWDVAKANNVYNESGASVNYNWTSSSQQAPMTHSDPDYSSQQRSLVNEVVQTIGSGLVGFNAYTDISNIPISSLVAQSNKQAGTFSSDYLTCYLRFLANLTYPAGTNATQTMAYRLDLMSNTQFVRTLIDTTKIEGGYVQNSVIISSNDYSSDKKLRLRLYSCYSTTPVVGAVARFSGITITSNSTYAVSSPSDSWLTDPSKFAVWAGESETSGNHRQPKTGASTIFTTTSSNYNSTTHWLTYYLTANASFTRAELYNKYISFFIDASTYASLFWIEQAQLFEYAEGLDSNGNSVMIEPNQFTTTSLAQIYYNYYNHNTYNVDNTEDAESIDYIYRGTTPLVDSNLIPVYSIAADGTPITTPTYEKIRSIDASKSNRFNLIQTIAETFECWARFVIDTDPNTGKTLYDETGRARKWVQFKKQIGTDTGLSFVYGIDVKGITRTIQSDQIVTKTIVNPNSNQFAKNGFCTIARSEQNYPRDTFVLNFDYYISQGLLSQSQVNNDLYGAGPNNIGYYLHLHELNTQYDDTMAELYQAQNELDKNNSYKKVYDTYVAAALEEVGNLKQNLMKKASVSNWEDVSTYIVQHSDDDEVVNGVSALRKAEESLANYQTLSENLESSIETLQGIVDEKTEAADDLKDQLKALHLQFFQKYSRFIQEGAWISENYIDDDLYYLDAESVAYTSSRPQVSYSISVIRLTGIEEFKYKIFQVGDIGYVEDTDFFGYTYINGNRTPYKETILISEVTSNFDSPEKDTLTIQNYKTQFEDLFQRITATTQTLQYASGQYARAANALNTDGTIKPLTLQDSISNNLNLVYASLNDAVYTDATGITVTDLTNPEHIVRITSNGIFITNDGLNWKNAVRGDGISADILTAGIIHSNEISIVDGNYESFRWDSTGINAYDLTLDDDEHVKSVDTSKFVRFDHYGIYGIQNAVGGKYVAASEDQIWDDAAFGMTWRGFFVKNKEGDGWVEVSSENDIAVVANDINRVKIGRIGYDSSNNPIYGMRISDATGAAVMETADDGTLWLQKALNIGTTEGGNYYASLGYLSGTNEDSAHEIFNANGKFIVYEDGSFVATEGTIEGNISADSGDIGGFTINNSSLFAGDKSSGYIEFNSQTQSLYGTDGSHYYNITPSTAYFNDIIAMGKISTMVFETSKTQVVGGSMLFKPTYKVKAVDNTDAAHSKLIIDLDTVIDNDDGATVEISSLSDAVQPGYYIYLIGSDGKLGDVYRIGGNSTDVDRDNGIITLTSALPSTNSVSAIVVIGNDKDLLIGINSTDAASQEILARGLTISEFSANNTNRGATAPKLFLGDLTSVVNLVDLPSISGYGLYSDNVYLRGSVITEVPPSSDVHTYAGINTLSKTSFNKSLEGGGFVPDVSNIVFWAGAAGITSEDIQNAPFQVTEQGTIYATQGYFEGVIRASNIYTSIIHGIGNTPALTIMDAANAIQIVSNDNELFTISNNGFTITDSNDNEVAFIQFESGNKITYAGSKFSTSLAHSGNHLDLEATLIGSYSDSDSSLTGYIQFDPLLSAINFGASGDQSAPELVLQPGLTFLNGAINTLAQTVIYKGANYNMKYVPVSNGYDLYVTNES